MWSSARAGLAGAGLLVLGACGWMPLHARGEDPSLTLRGEIAHASLRDQQIIRALTEARWAPSARAPAWELELELHREEVALVQPRAVDYTRAAARVRLRYRLYRPQARTPSLSGVVREQAAFERAPSPFAREHTRAANADLALRNAFAQMALEITSYWRSQAAQTNAP